MSIFLTKIDIKLATSKSPSFLCYADRRFHFVRSPQEITTVNSFIWFFSKTFSLLCKSNYCTFSNFAGRLLLRSSTEFDFGRTYGFYSITPPRWFLGIRTVRRSPAAPGLCPGRRDRSWALRCGRPGVVIGQTRHCYPVGGNSCLLCA